MGSFTLTYGELYLDFLGALPLLKGTLEVKLHPHAEPRKARDIFVTNLFARNMPRRKQEIDVSNAYWTGQVFPEVKTFYACNSRHKHND